jgi:hypothetical protein
MESENTSSYVFIMCDLNSEYGSGQAPKTIPFVTPHMVRSRTVELAVGAGRHPIEISQRDYEQAKRELTGETDFKRQQAVLYGF